jgi:hypothetical protein
MKTKGRAKSRNIVDNTNDTFNGKRNQFINESLSLAASNHKPSTRIGKKGTRKKPTGRLTGGGF